MAGSREYHAAMLDLDAVRERIRARYSDLGLSETGVWHKSHGMGQTTVRNFLAGMTQSLTLDTVQKLEQPLGVSAEWIIFGDAGSLLSEERIEQLAAEAVDEVKPDMSIGEIRRNVASVLRDQLALVLAGQVARGPGHLTIADAEGHQPLTATN